MANSIVEALLRYEKAVVRPEDESPVETPAEIRGYNPERTRLLQAYVDDDYEQFNSALLSQMSDYPSVIRMIEKVGDDWFDQIPFSFELKSSLVGDMITTALLFVKPPDIPDLWYQTAGQVRPQPIKPGAAQ